jgi:hypothetical protein
MAVEPERDAPIRPKYLEDPVPEEKPSIEDADLGLFGRNDDSVDHDENRRH